MILVLVCSRPVWHWCTLRDTSLFTDHSTISRTPQWTPPEIFLLRGCRIFSLLYYPPYFTMKLFWVTSISLIQIVNNYVPKDDRFLVLLEKKIRPIHLEGITWTDEHKFWGGSVYGVPLFSFSLTPVWTYVVFTSDTLLFFLFYTLIYWEVLCKMFLWNICKK